MIRDEFLSEEDLDLRNMSEEELDAYWTAWLEQAQATNDRDAGLGGALQKRPFGVTAVDDDPDGFSRSFHDRCDPLDQPRRQLQLGDKASPAATLGDRGDRLLALRHPQWGAIGLPLWAMLYVRQQTIAAIPKCRVVCNQRQDVTQVPRPHGPNQLAGMEPRRRASRLGRQ